MSRSYRTLSLALSVALLVPVVCQAQELRHQFQAGGKNAYTMDQTQNMKMSLMGQEIEIKIQMSFDITQTVDSVDTATGNAKIKQKIERVKMKMEGGPLGVMEFDSKSDKEPDGPLAAMAGILRAMTEGEIKMTMSNRGQVSDVKMPDKLMEEMKNIGGAAGPGANMFSEDSFKNMFNQAALILPKEAPVAGVTTWDQTLDLKMGPIGNMKSTTKYTYAGKSGAFDKIDMKMDMKFEADPNAPMQMKLTTKEANGTALFDNAKGRVHEITVKTVNEMDMGGIGTANMTQTMTMKLK